MASLLVWLHRICPPLRRRSQDRALRLLRARDRFWRGLCEAEPRREGGPPLDSAAWYASQTPR